MRKRLCILLPTHWAARMGGAQYQARILIARLTARYEVDITYLTTRANPDYRPEGYRVVQFSTPGGLRRYGFFFDARRLLSALDQARPDVIFQAVGCGHTGIAAYYAAHRDCRFYWRVSSDRSVRPDPQPWWRPHRRVERAFLDYGIRHADGIFAQTQDQQRDLGEYHGRGDAVLVRNFHPAPEGPQARRPGLRVLWIANLKPLKNPAAFVRLARRFGDRPDIEFVIIGAPMGPPAWNEEVLAAADGAANVKYLGSQSQAEVNRLLEDAHLLVNTSDYEGFSNTFIQAWMRGVPVVSLNVNPDSLLDGRLGLHSGSEERMLHDVKSLLDDSSRRDTMDAYCRRYAMEHHGEQNIDTMAQHMGLTPMASQEQQ